MGIREDNAASVPADRVLFAVSRELQQIAEMSEGLQFDISEVLKNYQGETPIRLYQLQNLDFITQTIAGLAVYMARLAQTAPDGVALRPDEAAQAIAMADLANRLARCQAADSPSDNRQEAGKCSFF